VQTKAYVAPRTPTEEVVANIWAEVLRRDKISIEDNFFDLGGHSLLATQVISRIREQFHIELPMKVLFEQPTVTGLSEAVAGTAQEAVDDDSAIVPVRRDSYRAGRP
jgi:acyl carrier protein